MAELPRGLLDGDRDETGDRRVVVVGDPAQLVTVRAGGRRGAAAAPTRAPALGGLVAMTGRPRRSSSRTSSPDGSRSANGDAGVPTGSGSLIAGASIGGAVR